MLSELKKRFGADPVVAEKLAEPAMAEPGSCHCGSGRWWLPVGQSQWRCEACSPPPSQSLVADRISSEPTVVEEYLVSLCRPWCDHCGSWLGIETHWSDDRTETRCWSCKVPMEQWPKKEARG